MKVSKIQGSAYGLKQQYQVLPISPALAHLFPNNSTAKYFTAQGSSSGPCFHPVLTVAVHPDPLHMSFPLYLEFSALILRSRLIILQPAPHRGEELSSCVAVGVHPLSRMFLLSVPPMNPVENRKLSSIKSVARFMVSMKTLPLSQKCILWLKSRNLKP